jgi:hypothetical protein
VIYLSQRFFHCWNASWNALPVMACSSLIGFSWIFFLSLIRRTACAHAQFSRCSSTTNAHSKIGQMAVRCQNLMLGVLSSRITLSMLVGGLFKNVSLFLNTPRTSSSLHMLSWHIQDQLCLYFYLSYRLWGVTCQSTVCVLRPIIEPCFFCCMQSRLH